MKNLNFRKNLISPEIAAWFIPVFLSSGISILLILFFVIPQYRKSNQANLDLKGLNQKKNELNNLKSQYKIINKKFDKLSKEKIKIIELITGTSSLDTLLSKLGEIGNNNNIDFISIIPKEINSFDGESKAKTNGKSATIEDPLFVEGVKKYLFDISLETEFVNLLSFLRELEFQENVILFRDIDVRSKKGNTEGDEFKGMLDIKLSMTIYGKI